VFSNRKWQQFALFLNLVGTALLFYSFQATSSDFRLVTATDHSAVAGESKQYALCVNNYTLIQTDSRTGVLLGHASCPDWAHARPAAVVNIEHPAFEGLGFVLLLLGFLIQYLSVPQPKTIAQIRAELKLLQAQEKQNRGTNT
jgi:hypothetical protein